MAGLACPGCRDPMQARDLERRASGTVVVELCEPCRALWFDPLESPSLSPAATLELFRAINAAEAAPRRPLPERMNCPRCDTPLAPTHDLQHATRFTYYRCLHGHGRLTPFVQFLREKNFIRPVPPEDLERLKSLVRVIRCSSCGAPIDLSTSTACPFCRAPIAILDPEAASRAVRDLAAADAGMAAAASGAAAPPVPDEAARRAASVMAAAQFEQAVARESAARGHGFAVDLVSIGLAALASALLSR